MDEQRDLTRRNALVAASGLGLSFLAGQDVAADEGQQKEQEKRKDKSGAYTPRLQGSGAGSPMNRQGERVGPIIYNVNRILQIQHHTFSFDSDSGADWVEPQPVILRVPPDSKTVASVISWHLSFLPDDHHAGLFGVNAWTTIDPSGAVLLHASAILRDDNGDDHWYGQLWVQVLVFS